MVKAFAILFLLCMLLSMKMDAASVQISAEMDGNEGIENQSLKGTITIAHNRDEAIDLSSLMLDNKPVKVEHIKDTSISPTDPLTLSMYRFELPGQPEGLYLVPEVKVNVGKKTYRSSTRSSYSVKKNAYLNSAPTPATQPSQAVSDQPLVSTPVLRLEASFEGKSSLYPGQLSKLMYRYFYSGNIQLVTETLPLLDAKGMQKIGEKEHKEYMEGGLNVQEISQNIATIKPGAFSYGPSLIEGFAYKEDASGHQVQVSEKLRSQAEAVELTVLPFPEKEQPASFYGAVGNLTFAADLSSSPELIVGSEFTLELNVTGKGYFKNIPFPELACQPGYSGFFRISDLPPKEDVKAEGKKVAVKLRPLTAEIKELPSIEFSYFDPDKEEYVVLHSPPIPVKIQPTKAVQELAESDSKEPENPPASAFKSKYEPRPIEIVGRSDLNKQDLYNKLFGTYWAMIVFPLALLLLLYQRHLHLYFIQQSTLTPHADSQQLIRQALEEKEPSTLFFRLTEEAFKRALFEGGLLPHADMASVDMPSNGVAGEVKNTLAKIEELRFSGKPLTTFSQIKQEVLSLYQKIKKSIVGQP